MTIRHLKIFAEVYRTGNITQAAENLHMTQPAVSRAIAELEQYYGIRLFERINRRIYITPCAESFYGYAMHILDTLDLMEQELKDWEGLGTLRIGTSISIGTKLLPDLVSEFSKKHPGIKIQASISNSLQVQNALLKNDLDLGLIEGSVSLENLSSEIFAQDRMVLIVPPDHFLLRCDSVKLEDIAQCDLLLREEGSAGREFLDHLFAVNDLAVKPLWESTSTQALINAVACGIGISILPETLVRDAVSAKRVCAVSIEGQDLARNSHIVWHSHKYLTPALLDFIDMCETSFPHLPYA